MCEFDLDQPEEFDVDPDDEQEHEQGIDPVAESWNEEF